MNSSLQDILRPMAQSLKIADLPSEDLRWIAERCGIETAIGLAVNYPGMVLYIPKECLKHLKKLYLERNFTGANLREMCIRLDISQTTANRWIREIRRNADPRQTDLFKDH